MRQQVDADGARTGWLRKPDPGVWAETLVDIVHMSLEERHALGERAKQRAKEMFGMEAMASGIEKALEAAVAMGPTSTTSAMLALTIVVLLLGVLLQRLAMRI